MGLVDDVCEDPVEAALDWHRTHIQPLSSAAIRHAVYAARTGLRRAIMQELPVVERLYLSDLMATQDAPEGIASFLEKRDPQWRHR